MQSSVSFIGKQNHLEIRIKSGYAFDEVTTSIINKFESSKNFFAGTSCVYVVGELTPEERLVLTSLLRRNYNILVIEFGTVPRPTRKVVTPERYMFMEFEKAPKLDTQDIPSTVLKDMERFKKRSLLRH